MINLYHLSLLLITLSLGPIKVYSQGSWLPTEYYDHIKAADSLLSKGAYTLASEHYQKAFESFGGRAAPDDRYNAARAFALAGNKDSTIITLQNLCTKNRVWDSRKLIADTAFSSISTSKVFTDIIDCMKANKEKYAPNFNYQWQKALDAIHDSDQAIRQELSDLLKQKANAATMAAFNTRMQHVDSSNLAFISRFIDQYGWRGANEVGQKGNTVLFLVIQHSPLAVQEKYLPVMQKAVLEKKARPDELAILEDRVSVAKHGYQIYGSQLRTDENGVTKVSAIKDEANVNKRRAAAGLMPLEEYLKLFNIIYTPSK